MPLFRKKKKKTRDRNSFAKFLSATRRDKRDIPDRSLLRELGLDEDESVLRRLGFADQEVPEVIPESDSDSDSDVSDISAASSIGVEVSPPGAWSIRLMDTDPVYLALMSSEDVDFVRKWVAANFPAVVGDMIYRTALQDRISDYLPELVFHPEEDPATIVNTVRGILKKLYNQFNLEGVRLSDTLNGLGLIQGTNIAAEVESHKERIVEVIEKLKRQIIDLQEEGNTQRLHIREYEARKAGVEAEIRLITDVSIDYLPQDQAFVENLENRANESQNLNNSLREELDRQELVNRRLKSQLIDLEKMIAVLHHEKIQAVAEVVQEAELNEGLKTAITNKITSLSANVDVVKRAIAEWMNKVESDHRERRIQIEQLRDESQRVEVEVDNELLNVSDLAQHHADLQVNTSMLAEEVAANSPQAPLASEEESFGSMDSPERVRGASPEHSSPEHLGTSGSIVDTPPRGSPASSVSPPSAGSPSMPAASPVAGPSHAMDGQLCIIPGRDITPEQFKTPWISKASRFSLTQAKKRGYYRNVPPGRNFQPNTAMRKRMVYNSPFREQPVVVNIDVDPKPLIQTARGEHFICDITVDLQDEGKEASPSGPVYHYGSPIPITPTTTRRGGISTPPGIFKKDHFAVRRLIDPFYEGPEDYFFSDPLPHDSRSPIITLPPTPPDISDRSISWENVPGLDRTSNKSPSPLIKRPAYISGSEASDSTSAGSPSPLIKRPVYTSGSEISDSVYTGSPSPGHDTSFDGSPSPIIKESPYRQRLMGTDSTYSDGPSFVSDKSVFESPSPLIERSFYESESETPDSHADSQFDQSLLENLLDGSFYRMESPGLDTTDENIRYRAFSPALMDKGAHRQISPDLDSTDEDIRYPVFESPKIKRQRSPGPDSDSPSPIIKRPTHGRRSPGTDSTYSDSPSPVTDESVHETPLPPIRRRIRRHKDLVPTYDQPPAVTPTTVRRHGKFTPRSVFQRGHVNVRRILGPSADSPEESPSPELQASNRTMSWEKLPSGGTIDTRSPSPLIKRPAYAGESETPDSTYTDNSSPLIKGPYGQGSPGLDSTLSDSPYSPYPAHDSSFDDSSSPMIQPPYGQGSPGLDSTYYEDSPFSVLEESFDESQSPMIQPPYGPRSPGLDSTFYEDSPFPVSEGSFEESPSAAFKRYPYPDFS